MRFHVHISNWCSETLRDLNSGEHNIDLNKKQEDRLMLPKSAWCFYKVHRPNVACLCWFPALMISSRVFEAIFEPHFEILHSNQDPQVLNA